jgi:hypothetical protein
VQVDLMFVPFMERQNASLLYWKGFKIRNGAFENITKCASSRCSFQLKKVQVEGVHELCQLERIVAPSKDATCYAVPSFLLFTHFVAAAWTSSVRS